MLNKAILTGRLTSDPELRRTQNNTAVVSFTLAVNRSFSRGEQSTDFIDIVAWSSTAEFVSKWFRKGMLIAVVGHIQTRTWKDKDGNSRKSVEVIAEEVQFAESKRNDDANYARPMDDSKMVGGPDFSASDMGGFEEISGDDSDLPF